MYNTDSTSSPSSCFENTRFNWVHNSLTRTVNLQNNGADALWDPPPRSTECCRRWGTMCYLGEEFGCVPSHSGYTSPTLLLSPQTSNKASASSPYQILPLFWHSSNQLAGPSTVVCNRRNPPNLHQQPSCNTAFSWLRPKTPCLRNNMTLSKSTFSCYSAFVPRRPKNK